MNILSKVGVDREGPFIVISDIDRATRAVHRVEGETFTLVKHPKRYCVGSYDILTKQRDFCENRQELPDDYKDSSCPACNAKTGFNPSFYHGGGLTSQQREYNELEHVVYLAYFSPRHLKVGITSKERGILRLLEQGARSAMILDTFESAYAARELEETLCSNPGIYESLRATEKYRLLTNARHDHVEATALMDRTVREVFRREPTESLNLDAYYSRDTSVFAGSIHVPDNPSDTTTAGICMGMVGDILLMRQDDCVYAVPLKSYVAHGIDYVPGKISYEYQAPIEQFALF